MKSQSATEYLLSHLWMLLAVAIFIYVLFFSGVFSFIQGPRAYPGSCTVLRPYGEDSVLGIGLGGLCNNELPEYVMEFGQYGNQGAWAFTCSKNGSCADFVTTLSNTAGVCNLTLSVWSYDLGMGPNGPVPELNAWTDGTSGAVPHGPALGGSAGLFYKTPSTAGAFDIEYNDTLLRFEARNVSDRQQYLIQGQFLNTWINTVLVLDNGIATGYINGVAVTTPSTKNICPPDPVLPNATIGSWDRTFHGYISNVQIYDGALTANEVKELYIEGLGGVPVNLDTIIEWFPLNGNMNNYAGNTGKSGTDNVVYFSSSYPVPVIT